MILGGVDIGSDLYRENIIGHSRVSGQMVRARDNSAIIFAQDSGPLEFDLVGGDNFGTLTKAQISSLSDLAAVSNAVYDLVYNSETISVLFRIWEQPVIEGDPLGQREAMLNTDIYRNVRIKLMEA